MSKLRLYGSTSGYKELVVPAVSDNAEVNIDNVVQTTHTGNVSITGTVTANGLTVDTDTLHVDATNNRVGIGTSSPTSQLSFGANIGRDFAVYEGAGGANKYGIGMSGDGSGGDPFRTKIYANGVESVSITSDGRMGIGTDTPGATLDVRGTAFIGPASTVDDYQGMSFVQGKDSSVTDTVSFIDFRNNEFTADAHIFAYHITDGSSAMAFSTTPAGSRSTDRRQERMRINSSGHVTKPDQPLFVGRLDAKTSTTSNYVIGVSQIYNRSMSFNATNDRITVPTSGYYQLHAQQLYTSSGGIYLFLRVNGSQIVHGFGSMGATNRDLVSNAIWYLNANDYVDFFLQGTSTYSWTGGHSLCYVQLVQ